MKGAGVFTLVFALLLIISSHQTVFAQTAVKDEEAAVSTEPEPELDYTETNVLTKNVIFQKINGIFLFFKKNLSIAWAFFLALPPLIKKLIYISFFPASLGIIASHVIGIYKNRNIWQKHPNNGLMYSYFVKSGTLQRKQSYKEAHSLLRDRTWLWISFAGLAFRLGNYANKSVMLMFVMSIAYIPLSIIGFVEMVLRILFGTVWLIVCNMLHRLILLVTKLITRLLIPVSYIIDKFLRETQYCPHCYDTFNIPDFVCPSCGMVHKRLIPGNCGVLFARCACNNTFLPCTSFTGRSRLASECPACKGKLDASNARHFSIALIGGNNAGKTAFIAALSNLYANLAGRRRNLTIEMKPDYFFNDLNNMYSSGITSADSESRTYNIIHKHGKIYMDNFVLYDTFAQYVVSNAFPRSPKYLGFCDGIILMIDPLSVQSVQDELAQNGTAMGMSLSSDDTNKLVVQFIHQYNTICGFTTGVMSNIPVAVLINKVDNEVVKREIGMTAIKASYDENPLAYNNNEFTAKDQICRAYLVKIGLINVVNNIEAIFTNISFFPVSAIGHKAEEGRAFTPAGILEPVAWIAQKKHSRLIKLLGGGN